MTRSIVVFAQNPATARITAATSGKAQIRFANNRRAPESQRDCPRASNPPQAEGTGAGGEIKRDRRRHRKGGS